MARMLLVHGSNHGAWCWAALLPELAALGHEGAAIDLPGAGDDPADPSAVTLDDCAARVAGAIRPGDIVVAHSLGGISATLGLDRRPGVARGLVYLAAWVPVPDRALAEYRGEGATPALLAAVRRGPVPETTVFDPDTAPDLFYPELPAAVARGLAAQQRPQPVSVMRSVVRLTQPPPPRGYVRCLRDRAIAPDYQRRVSADWPAGRVAEMDCGHSPFASHPARLAAILNDIAGHLPEPDHERSVSEP